MTSRERWTVYPLLFLSLGMGLRSRLEPADAALTCQSLTVLNRQGQPAARLGTTTADRGQLDLLGPDGKPFLMAGTTANGKGGQLSISGGSSPVLVASATPDGKTGQMTILNDRGVSQVRLFSTGQTGVIETCDAGGVPRLILHTSQRGGNIASFRNDQKLLMTFGHNDQDSGVFAVDAVTGQRAGVPFATITRPADQPKQNGDEGDKPAEEPSEPGSDATAPTSPGDVPAPSDPQTPVAEDPPASPPSD